MTVERTGYSDDPTGPVARRTYEFRVGWSALPGGREFFGQLTCATPGGPVAVGSVTGTRPPDPPFTPAVLRVNAVGSADVFVFPRKWSLAPWALAPGWVPPAWLTCEWHEEADRQVLRVTARGAPPGADRAGVRVTAGGRVAVVPVEVAGR